MSHGTQGTESVITKPLRFLFLLLSTLTTHSSLSSLCLFDTQSIGQDGCLWLQGQQSQAQPHEGADRLSSDPGTGPQGRHCDGPAESGQGATAGTEQGDNCTAQVPILLTLWR